MKAAHWSLEVEAPPLTEGLPLRSLASLLAPHRELLSRIPELLDAEEPAIEAGVEATVLSLAAWLQLLPASRAHHHAEAGGLLRHSLEVGVDSLCRARNWVGDLTLPSQRRAQQELCFRLAALLGGLCHDLGKPLSDIKVTDPSGLLVWNPFKSSLSEWALGAQIDYYYWHWQRHRANRHRLMTPLKIGAVIDPRLWIVLRREGPGLESDLLEALLEESRSSALAALIKTSDQVSTERDLKDPRRPLDGLFTRTPAGLLLEGMRAAIREGLWEANRPGQVLWHFADGLYLAWPSAQDTLAERILADGLSGIPLESDLLADFLEDQGIASPPPGSEPGQSALVVKIPPFSEVPMKFLRLRTPALLYPGVWPSIAGARDPALEEPQEAPVPVAEIASPTPDKDIDSWLLRLAEVAAAYHWERADDRLFIDHQGAAKALDTDTRTLILRLDQGGHLDLDPTQGRQKVRMHRGRRGIFLNPASTRLLLKAQPPGIPSQLKTKGRWLQEAGG